jgi:hypothetical protein
MTRESLTLAATSRRELSGRAEFAELGQRRRQPSSCSMIVPGLIPGSPWSTLQNLTGESSITHHTVLVGRLLNSICSCRQRRTARPAVSWHARHYRICETVGHISRCRYLRAQQKYASSWPVNMQAVVMNMWNASGLKQEALLSDRSSYMTNFCILVLSVSFFCLCPLGAWPLSCYDSL